MSEGAKILLIDIETAPILGYVWDLWNQNIGLQFIKKDWHILSFAAKWLGEKKVIYSDQRNAKNIENDTPLLKEIWKLLDEADIVVTQNGDAFDLPKIKARMIIAGMKPPSPFRTVDTKKVASRTFGFTSNKQEYMTDKICPEQKKSQHKKFPGIELWLGCLAHDNDAWEEMKKYNIQDVLGLEALYLKMRPWIIQHPNVGMYYDSDRPRCPKCGGARMVINKHRITRAGKYIQYKCESCGGYARGATQQAPAKQRKLQLHN